MKQLSIQYVVSKTPREYLKQGFTHCGAFSVKAILSAYGKDVKENPQDYHQSWFGRVTGSSLHPSTCWVRVLCLYGLQAKVESVSKLSPGTRLTYLKELLTKDAPVMIRIGNGYLPSGRYLPLLGKILPHWITVWGYDDRERVFYVYDSCVPKTCYAKDIPIGNTKRTYAEMARDWHQLLLPYWRGLYIKVNE